MKMEQRRRYEGIQKQGKKIENENFYLKRMNSILNFLCLIQLEKNHINSGNKFHNNNVIILLQFV